MKNLLRLLVLLGAIWFLVGCGSDKGTSTPAPEPTPDVTITIPDVEPTPDVDPTPRTTRPRPPTTRPPTTRPPITVPDPTPEPSPEPSAINGQCGTVIETCAAGKYINTPDASDTARWLCQGKNGGNSVTCSQRFPAPSISVVRNFISRADNNGTTVHLAWTKPKTFVRDELDQYIIEQAPDNSGSPGTWSRITYTKQTDKTINGLSPTTKYHFRIRAQGNVTGSDWVSHIVTTKARPLIGTGSIKLMADGIHVGNASISPGHQDITLTETITNILCTSSYKARVHDLFVGKIDTDYWGTEDDEFCGVQKTALNDGDSKVTLSIGHPNPEEGLIRIHHTALSGDVIKIHIQIFTTDTNKIDLIGLILMFKKYITRSVGKERETKYYYADGTDHESLNG